MGHEAVASVTFQLNEVTALFPSRAGVSGG